MNRKILTKCIAIGAAGMFILSGCASSEKTDNSSTAPTTTSSATDNTSSNETDKKIDIYLDDVGPYYFDPNSMEKVYLNSGSNDDYSDYSFGADPIYGEYEGEGIKYTLPDGWYTDTSFGSPMIYEDNSESSDENIVLSPANYFVEGKFSEVSQKKLEKTFQNYVDEGSCVSFEIKPIENITKVSDLEAKAFSCIVEAYDYSTMYDENGEYDENKKPDTKKYYTEYVIINTSDDAPYAMVINADNEDASIKKMNNIRDSILGTLKIDPDALPKNDMSGDELTIDGDEIIEDDVNADEKAEDEPAE